VIHSAELLRVLIFVGAASTIFALAALVLERRFLSRRRTPIRGWGRWVLAAATLGLGCMAYGRWIEPRWVEVTRTRVVSSRLRAGHPGVRIVHLSDFHCDPEPLAEPRLAQLIAPLKPDVIVFTGDCTNSMEGVPVFKQCLSALAKLAPVFVVRGNWDTFHHSGDDRFAGTGAIELDGSSATIDVAGAAVHIAGAAFQSPDMAVARALESVSGSGPLIVLHHLPYPDLIPLSFAARVDLMCAGHVHGGQVALPFYGALLTLSKYGKRFERGLYPDADGLGFPLYVSRGLGMEGGSVPRVRFCSRPEVALIELVAQ
jgi:predicted MPP superfamily phosphohydrolase